MACINKLSGDIEFDKCVDAPQAGVLDNAILINYDDIDFGASTSNGATITNLTLKSGATGYKLEWGKRLGSLASEFTPDAENLDGFSHSFLARLMTPSASTAERAAEIKEGRFVVVIETKYKGVDQLDAFKVLGWKSGLELSEMTMNSGENASSITFTISTYEGEYEDYPYSIFLETDYATSKASFDALFASVA
ncbi:hypothetical protein [Zunongwangia atlantica]|uniref:Uncharacterized protein n=1 Tax=Zunongwangia atlantica 22II14-10F7 TaxID=1185767 RepID=A0A1Y1T2Z0_9FLAO|nr:hypothetical protein [Zunongwangia atlantica]ORL45397.1 hypothetical protein IIF7_11263 [Zunongwangia atlantica 22II14-10F7]